MGVETGDFVFNIQKKFYFCILAHVYVRAFWILGEKRRSRMKNLLDMPVRQLMDVFVFSLVFRDQSLASGPIIK